LVFLHLRFPQYPLLARQAARSLSCGSRDWEGRGGLKKARDRGERGRTFVPELIGVTRGADDGELGGGEEGAGCCFSGHFEGSCYRVAGVQRYQLVGWWMLELNLFVLGANSMEGRYLGPKVKRVVFRTVGQHRR
jgi:hypothetical protein